MKVIFADYLAARVAYNPEVVASFLEEVPFDTLGAVPYSDEAAEAYNPLVEPSSLEEVPYFGLEAFAPFAEALAVALDLDQMQALENQAPFLEEGHKALGHYKDHSHQSS